MASTGLVRNFSVARKVRLGDMFGVGFDPELSMGWVDTHGLGWVGTW